MSLGEARQVEADIISAEGSGHILDVTSIDLIDESWLLKYDDPIRARLKELLDDPDG